MAERSHHARRPDRRLGQHLDPKTSLEAAKEHGYRLAYLPTDMSAADYRDTVWESEGGSSGGDRPQKRSALRRMQRR